MLGGALAWLVERTDLPAPTLVRALVILPMATPPFLLAISWIILLSPRTGVINSVLMQTFGLGAPPFNIYSLGGMILVEGLALVPSAFLILAPAARNLDPSLEESALVSGANTGQLVFRIILPLLLPVLAGTAIFLMIVSFVVFDVPGTIGHAVAHLRPLQPDLQPGGGQSARDFRIRQGQRHGADVHRGPARAHPGVSPAHAARGPLRDRDRARLPAACLRSDGCAGSPSPRSASIFCARCWRRC